MISDLPIAVRDAVPGDASYIIKSWLRNYRKSYRGARIPKDIYYDTRHGHHALVVGVLQRARVLVACSDDNPDQIFGWVCYEPEATVHYIHVKMEMQGFGIATRLLEAAGMKAGSEIISSHWNDECDRAMSAGIKISYNPYWAMVS